MRTSCGRITRIVADVSSYPCLKSRVFPQPARAAQESGARRYTGPVAPPRLPTVTLMQPTLIAKPFHRAGWVYEEKYDGWRVLAYKKGRGVQLVSRAGRDLTRRFPELVTAV